VRSKSFATKPKATSRKALPAESDNGFDAPKVEKGATRAANDILFPVLPVRDVKHPAQERVPVAPVGTKLSRRFSATRADTQVIDTNVIRAVWGTARSAKRQLEEEQAEDPAKSAPLSKLKTAVSAVNKAVSCVIREKEMLRVISFQKDLTAEEKLREAAKEAARARLKKAGKKVCQTVGLKLQFASGRRFIAVERQLRDMVQKIFKDVPKEEVDAIVDGFNDVSKALDAIGKQLELLKSRAYASQGLLEEIAAGIREVRTQSAGILSAGFDKELKKRGIQETSPKGSPKGAKFGVEPGSPKSSPSPSSSSSPKSRLLGGRRGTAFGSLSARDTESLLHDRRPDTDNDVPIKDADGNETLTPSDIHEQLQANVQEAMGRLDDLRIRVRRLSTMGVMLAPRPTSSLLQEGGDVKEPAAVEVTNCEQQELLSALEDLLCESAMDDLVAHALGEIEPEEEGMTSIAEQSPAEVQLALLVGGHSGFEAPRSPDRRRHQSPNDAQIVRPRPLGGNSGFEGRVLFTSESVAEVDEEAAEEENTDEAEVVVEKDIVGSSWIEKVVRGFEAEVDTRQQRRWDRVADAANNDSLWRGGHGGKTLPNHKAGIEAVLMERRERQNIIKVVQLPPLRHFPSSGSVSSPSSASSWTPLATPRVEAVGPWPLMTPSASAKSLCTDRFLQDVRTRALSTRSRCARRQIGRFWFRAPPTRPQVCPEAGPILRPL